MIGWDGAYVGYWDFELKCVSEFYRLTFITFSMKSRNSLFRRSNVSSYVSFIAKFLCMFE